MITTDEVIAFFDEVHGHPPFPWQVQLAEAALVGDWPDAVDAPTGLGKTWSIDVAVLAMADAGLRGQRDVFRRAFFVVDRRTVVDEAWAHAQVLERQLKAAAAGSVVGRVADGLRALAGGSGDRSPLEVTRMRGGVTWDSRWADRPDQPVVVLSTVDQVGSRLLFRGYGVSNGMRPIHAALVGCHSLLMLDEAHLSRPFATLLDDVRSVQQAGLPVAGLRTLSLSATPEGEARLLTFDEDAHLAVDEARRRLLSDKRLAVLQASPAGRHGAIAKAVRDINAGGSRRILAVCNTVAGARTVHQELRNLKINAGLLTGRSRPLDRQLVVDEWLAQLGREAASDPPADSAADSTVLVATQTVEVGVNLDVDWLVTEECAQSALVQRLGRVNRFGDRTGGAVVVATGADDPVYRDAAANTTRWLLSHGASVITGVRQSMDDREDWLDVGPLALRHIVDRQGTEPSGGDGDPNGGGPLNRPPVAAPMIHRALFDHWAQTSPVPAVDVPVEQYLHGLGSADPTISVAWRADVTAAGGDRAQLLSVPVSAAECIELPLAAFRRWVAGAEAGPVADLDGIGTDQTIERGGRARRVGDDLTLEEVAVARLRPGDTVVIPTTQGGLDRWGWAPESTSPALDIADLVERRGRHLVRLAAATLRPLVQGVPAAVDRGWDEKDDTDWEPVAAALQAVESAQASGSASAQEIGDALSGLAAALRGAIGSRTHPVFETLVDRIAGAELTGGVLSIKVKDGLAPSDLTGAMDEREGSTAMLGARVSLDQHSRAVGARARDFAAGLGLSASLATAVERAGHWHDLGKRDLRFQAMLWGGVRPHSGAPLLAKSGVPPRSPLGRMAASLSGYPPGMRHEALSARLVEALMDASDADLDGVDRQLLAHLVAAHHGRARPLVETVDDPQPERVAWAHDGHEVNVTTDIAEDLAVVRVFDELNDRYGPWGLALLESIVRLADMACSSEGS